MQTLNANQSFNSGEPVWVLLAELSLGDFLSDQDWREEPAAGYLLQSLRELGMSTEYMENMARTLAGFATEAVGRAKQGGLEVPGRIRIFCQRKMIADATSAKTSRAYHPEHGKEHAKLFPDSRENTIGGWGYFMIERGKDLPPDSPAIPHNSIDLYLYKEGKV